MPGNTAIITAWNPRHDIQITNHMSTPSSRQIPGDCGCWFRESMWKFGLWVIVKWDFMLKLREFSNQGWNKREPSGRAIHVPLISTRIFWGFKGIIHVEISLEVPAKILEKWRGVFYLDISASFPCGIPGDISTWKFPLRFPQNFKMPYNDIPKCPSCVKISQWWFDVILWWINVCCRVVVPCERMWPKITGQPCFLSVWMIS